MRFEARIKKIALLAALTLSLFCLSCSENGTSLAPVETKVIVDAAGREVQIPIQVEHVICSGSGTLRLLTYLQAQKLVAGVDSIEIRGSVIETRPYALANPQYAQLPLFGEFRGYDNPELILSLDPAPQVIIRTETAGGDPPDRLSAKTGIPVVVIKYGDLVNRRRELNEALTLTGQVVGKQKRAEEVINFFDYLEYDLRNRTSQAVKETEDIPTCYVGGIAMRGPHGFHSTEPAYPPFEFTNAANVAAELSKDNDVPHAVVSKEKILVWDPEVVFVDISTARIGSNAGALYELKHDRAYRELKAVVENKVYAVLPYNSYNANFGSIFANAYYIGSVLYPQQFNDIDPRSKADEIYKFLLGEPVFEQMNSAFNGMAFNKITINRR